MQEQKYKTEYKAITKEGLEQFNEELKMYTNNGYIPCCDFNMAIYKHPTEQNSRVCFYYSILLSKTTKI